MSLCAIKHHNSKAKSSESPPGGAIVKCRCRRNTTDAGHNPEAMNFEGETTLASFVLSAAHTAYFRDSESRNTRLRILETILKATPNVNASGKKGNTALHALASHLPRPSPYVGSHGLNRVPIVQLLLKKAQIQHSGTRMVILPLIYVKEIGWSMIHFGDP